MTEETKKPRKPRAKKVAVVGDIQTVEVPVANNPGWDTPIYEIVGHPKFIHFLSEEMRNLYREEIPAGRRRNTDLEKVIDNFLHNQERMRIEYIKMMNKDSQVPSAQRKWIKQIIETCVFLTIKHFEKKQS